MLNIDDLHAHYGDSHVLRGITLALASGVSMGLLGRNGMGKTTLIRALMGYVPVTRGGVRWHDKSITGHAPERVARLGVGYVPEGRGIFANLSVRENLLMSARSGVNGEQTGDDHRLLATLAWLAAVPHPN